MYITAPRRTAADAAAALAEARAAYADSEGMPATVRLPLRMAMEEAQQAQRSALAWEREQARR